MKRIAWVVLFLLIAASALAAPPKPGRTDMVLHEGGFKRTFALWVPKNYVDGTPFPLVVALHGAGGTGDQVLDRYGWAAKADAENFLVIAPDALAQVPERKSRFLTNPQVWNDGSGRAFSGKNHVDDVRFIEKAIETVASQYAVDHKRIFVTGFSNGGSMTFNLIARSTMFAAAAPAGNANWVGVIKAVKPIPVWYLIGGKDPLNPKEGGDIKLPWGITTTKPPIAQSVSEAKTMLGCSGTPKNDTSRAGIRTETWTDCAPGASLRFTVIENAGHVWPGAKRKLPKNWVGNPAPEMDATAEIWQFFKNTAK